jgi:hypothetical protein
VEALNDALMHTERAFLSDAGLPLRPWFRHRTCRCASIGMAPPAYLTTHVRTHARTHKHRGVCAGHSHGLCWHGLPCAGGRCVRP